MRPAVRRCPRLLYSCCIQWQLLTSSRASTQYTWRWLVSGGEVWPAVVMTSILWPGRSWRQRRIYLCDSATGRLWLDCSSSGFPSENLSRIVLYSWKLFHLEKFKIEIHGCCFIEWHTVVKSGLIGAFIMSTSLTSSPAACATNSGLTSFLNRVRSDD